MTWKRESPRIEVGIDSFAAAFTEDTRAVSALDRLRDLVDEIERADKAGLGSFGIGEHHRKEFLDSAPPVILGAAAARTEMIRLTSAVSVLSATDRVRLFQEFATVDLLSRAVLRWWSAEGRSSRRFSLRPQSGGL